MPVDAVFKVFDAYSPECRFLARKGIPWDTIWQAAAEYLHVGQSIRNRTPKLELSVFSRYYRCVTLLLTGSGKELGKQEITHKLTETSLEVYS